MKNIAILGATGSIGNAALRVIDSFKNKFYLVSISIHSNIDKMLNIIDQFSPEYAIVTDIAAYTTYYGHCESVKYKNTTIFSGEPALEKIYKDTKIEMVVNGISGKAGILPTYNLLLNKKNIALANKESLVCAGPILKKLAKQHNLDIIPVDSEHSAIFQLLNKKKEVSNLVLTASGGPFLHFPKENWNTITVEQALAHPTWKMGNKISIDSATMANKGLEVIEANMLFDFDYDRIKVMIHPQSLIHSMIETIDGEIYAQIGPNDMAIPVQNALTYPKLEVNTYNRFDLTKSYNFELFPVDLAKFKMLDLAYFCGKSGKMLPPFYNYANEILVNLFLDKKISFQNIEETMEKCINIFLQDNHALNTELTISALYELDRYCLDLINSQI